MDALLANQQVPWLTATALLLAIAAGVGGAALRARARRVQQRVKRLYWWDAGACAWTWAGATVAVAFAGLLGVEGLAMPVWVAADLAAGAVIGSVLIIRWRRERLWRLPDLDTGSVGSPTRVVSTSWEFGVMGAFLGVLVAYGASMGHGFGHPIHWVVTALGVPLGYALGLALATPRYSVKRPG